MAKTKKRYTKKRSNLPKRNAAKIKQIAKQIERKSILVTGTQELLRRDNPYIKSIPTLISQGDQGAMREGDKIQAAKLFIRGYVANDNTAATDNIVRIFLIRYKESHGNTLSIATLLNSPTNVNSVLKKDTSSKYVIDMDETIAMDLTAHTLIPFKITKKLNHEVSYINNEQLDSDIYKNNYFIVAYSTTDGITSCPRLSYQLRYSYTDI